MIATAIRLTLTPDLVPEVTLTLADSRQVVAQRVAEWQGVLENGKRLTVEVTREKKRRSLDANAYLWVLLGKMAAVLQTDKDAVYIEMLSRYGVYTHVVVKPQVAERVKQEWRTVRELGEVTVNGKVGIQLQCYFGSSSYTTAEMATLIDGVISECKDMGIETATPAELERMKGEWGR